MVNAAGAVAVGVVGEPAGVETSWDHTSGEAKARNAAAAAPLITGITLNFTVWLMCAIPCESACPEDAGDAPCETD